MERERERERERELGSSVTLSDVTLPNNFYIINILKISPLDYIYMCVCVCVCVCF